MNLLEITNLMLPFALCKNILGICLGEGGGAEKTILPSAKFLSLAFARLRPE